MPQVAANSIYSKMDRTRLFDTSFCLKNYYCVIFPSIDLECSPSPTTLISRRLPPQLFLSFNFFLFSSYLFFSSFLLFARYFPFSSSIVNLAISSALFSLVFFPRVFYFILLLSRLPFLVILFFAPLSTAIR